MNNALMFSKARGATFWRHLVRSGIAVWAISAYLHSEMDWKEFLGLLVSIGVASWAAERLLDRLVFGFSIGRSLQMKFPADWQNAQLGHFAVNEGVKTLVVGQGLNSFVVGIWLRYNWFGQIIRPTLIKCQLYQLVGLHDRLRWWDPTRRLHPLVGMKLMVNRWSHRKWTDEFNHDYLKWVQTVDGAGFRCTPSPPPQWLLGDPLVCEVIVSDKLLQDGILQCQVVTDDNHEIIIRRRVSFKP